MKTVKIETQVPAIVVNAEFINDVIISKSLIMNALESGDFDMCTNHYNNLLSVHNFLASLLKSVDESNSSYEQKYAPFGKKDEMPY
jgi:hypothetical protein